MNDRSLIPRAEAAAALLAPFSAATVHEAYGRRGAVEPSVKPISPGLRLCAPAFTATTMPGSNLALHQALPQTPRGWVLAAATEGDTRYGYWGDLFTASAQALGIAGLVLEGSVRDVAELRASGLPIFAGGVSMRGTVKIEEGAIGCAIALGGVSLAVGDVVVADDDGVVVVRIEDSAWVAAASAGRVAKEDANIGALREGRSTLELYDLPRGESAWRDG